MFNFDEIMQVFSEELRKAEIAFADVSAESEIQKIKSLMSEISKPFGKIPSTLRKELGLAETTTRSQIVEALQKKLDSLGQEQKVEERVKESTGVEPSDLALKYKDKLKKEYDGYLSKDKQKLIDEYKLALKMPAKTEEQINARDEMLSAGKDTYEAFLVAKKTYEDWNKKTPKEQNEIANLRETDRIIEEQKKKIPSQNRANLDKARAALAVIDQKVGRLPEGTAKDELTNAQKVRREALQSYEKDYASNPMSTIGALDSFLADVTAESQRATKDMNREDLLANYAIQKEVALQNALETLASSERESDKQLYAQVKEQIGQKPTEDAKAYMSRLGSLMGSVALPAMRVQKLVDVSLKSELDGLKDKELKKRLDEMKPVDRIDYMLERVGVPGESKQAPRTYIKDELEKLYGKEVSEVLGSPLFLDKNVDKPGFLTTVNKLEKARQQLDESDWKDSKHKDSILLEVAANPMSSEKILTKYKDFKPESDAKASEYFDKMRKITQSKMDLDTLRRKNEILRKDKMTDPALITQIAEKEKEFSEYKKDLYGDTSKLDEYGSRLKAVGTDLEKARGLIKSYGEGSAPYNIFKKRIGEMEKEQKDLYKKMEPLLKPIMEAQKSIPPADRNEYARIGFEVADKKKTANGDFQQAQKAIAQKREAEELEAEKLKNRPLVARLKETWLDKIKSEPTFIQDRIKSKLASIGDLSNKEFQAAEQELRQIASERIPVPELPAKEVAEVGPRVKPEIEGLPEMKPEVSPITAVAQEPVLEGAQPPVQTAEQQAQTLEENQAKANQIVELNKQLASLTEALSTAVDEKAKRDLATQIAAIEQQLNNLKGV